MVLPRMPLLLLLQLLLLLGPAAGCAALPAEPCPAPIVVVQADELLRAGLAAAGVDRMIRSRRETAEGLFAAAQSDLLDEEERAEARRVAGDWTIPLLWIEPRGCDLPGVPVGPALVDERLQPWISSRSASEPIASAATERLLVEVFALSADRIQMAFWPQPGWQPSGSPVCPGDSAVELLLVAGAWQVQRVYLPPLHFGPPVGR